MTDIITLTGLVATVPHVVDGGEKVPFISFRLASNQRYFDRRTSEWVAADTNWYTVTAFRALAINAGISVHKGDRVLVTGRLKIRRWEAGDKNGVSVDVEADSIGHDLVWGTAHYARTVQREQSPAVRAASGETDAGQPGDTGVAMAAGQAPVMVGAPEPTEAWAVTVPGSSADGSVASTLDQEPPF